MELLQSQAPVVWIIQWKQKSGSKNLIHSHSKHTNIENNNNQDNSNQEYRPETVSNGSFKRPPPTSANKAILSLDLPASHYATQPNTANTTDDESKNKKSYTSRPGIVRIFSFS